MFHKLIRKQIGVHLVWQDAKKLLWVPDRIIVGADVHSFQLEVDFMFSAEHILHMLNDMGLVLLLCQLIIHLNPASELECVVRPVSDK